MPRPKRMGRRVSFFVPIDAEKMLAKVSAARAKSFGVDPLMADLWREAVMRGLDLMLGDLRTNTRPMKKR